MTDATTSQSSGPFDVFAAPFKSLAKYRFLIAQLIKRNWAIRYKGTAIGFSWIVLKPLLLLTAFVFVRGIILRGRVSPIEVEGMGQNFNTAVFLFCGLMFYFFSSEIVQRSAGLILQRRGYVKRLVFPLETFAFIAVGAATLQFAISFIMLTLVMLIGGGGFSLMSLQVLLLFAPLLFLWCGFLWLVGSIGVFVRDIGQFMGLASMSMLFLGPIFYSLREVPEEFRSYMYINPITFPVSQTRLIVMEGASLDWQGLGIYFAIAITLFYVGFFVFSRLRKGFADVL